jgi:hypothetical protein
MTASVLIRYALVSYRYRMPYCLAWRVIALYSLWAGFCHKNLCD